jgi:hypothetical protein
MVVPYRFFDVLFFRFRSGTQFNQPVQLRPHAYRLPYHARQDAARDGTSNQSPPWTTTARRLSETKRNEQAGHRRTGIAEKIRVQLHKACAVQTAATLLRSEPQEIACSSHATQPSLTLTGK